MIKRQLRHLHRAGLTLALATLAAALPLSAHAQGRPDLVAASLKDSTKTHVPGELLVQFKPGASDAAKDNALAGLGARIHDDIRMGHQRLDGKGDLHLVRLPVGLTVAAAMRGLERDASVDFAEPNWVYRHSATSNDLYYENGSLWGMYGDASSPANGFGSQAAEAWTRGNTCGQTPVYIGIIDEGYMTSHPDLALNVGTNPGEVAGNGIDDDGNGYVDDVNGWDFDGNNNSVFDGVGDDHGTHVSGTIGATGGNGVGVAGVCWSVKLISAKFLGSQGGTTANAIKAVDYLTDLKTRHSINLVASNNSWGGGGFSLALADAIERANTANILFIAAAGNDGVNNDTSPHYPSSYGNANIIAVASITSSGALSSFSNYGASTVDIGAPGSGIWSTVPVRKKGKVAASYASYSGTSMATPHVSGAAAMYASTHSGATAAQIKAAILGAAIPTASLAGKTVTGGRLNVSGF
ncbi:S8 family peptidase [Piscinibacter sp.]|uniref:S8 family peptidase n=1 Tax=Piscinibacter sp. TaxID=1903157 RepID=UPI002F419CCB